MNHHHMAYATRGIDSSFKNEKNRLRTGGSYCTNYYYSGDGMGDGSGKYGTSCVIFCNDFFDKSHQVVAYW